MEKLIEQLPKPPLDVGKAREILRQRWEALDDEDDC